MSDVFISYDHDDAPRVDHIVDGLKQENVAFWWDRHLKDGDIFPVVIQEKLDEMPHVLVAWSARSTKSRYVIGEALAAFDQGKLLQVVLDDARLIPPFNTVQATFLNNWSGDILDQRWRKLMARIRGEVIEETIPSGGGPVRAATPADLTSRQVTRAGVSGFQALALWFMPFLLFALMVTGLVLAFDPGWLPISPENKGRLFLLIGGGVIAGIAFIILMLMNLLLTGFVPPRYQGKPARA